MDFDLTRPMLAVARASQEIQLVKLQYALHGLVEALHLLGRVPSHVSCNFEALAKQSRVPMQ